MSRLTLASLFASLAVAGAATAQPSFEIFGPYPGGNSHMVNGVSGDGEVVFGDGTTNDGISFGYIWRRETGFRLIGSIVGPTSRAEGVSTDGTFVAGESTFVPGDNEPRTAFRWTTPPDMFVDLGDLEGGDHDAIAFCVSDDGATLFGAGNSADGLEAFRWTQEDGLEGLGDLPGGFFNSGLTDTTPDGSIASGFAYSDNGFEAVRWTESDGFETLGDLPGGDHFASASAISANGEVIVGLSASTASEKGGGSSEAFRWTEEDGIEALGALVDNEYDSRALGVSADGSVIVGNSDAGPFIWTEETGMLSLYHVLRCGYGLDLDGVVFMLSANGVSDDGQTVVGTVAIPGEFVRGYIAEITLPLPSIADLDFDGTVGSSDLAMLIAAWGADGPADLDNSGAVDSSDLAMLIAAWGPCGS